MTWQGPEPAVAALVAKLETELPDAIDAINVEIEDGFELEHPQQVLDHLPPLYAITAFPTVAVLYGAGTAEDDTGYEATGSYVWSVVWVVTDVDLQALSKKLLRYELAGRQVALPRERNWGSGPGLPWGLTMVAVDYGPTLSDKESGERPDRDYAGSYVTWCETAIRGKLDEL